MASRKALDPQRLERVKELLAEALEKDAGEREPFLAAACDDDVVRREVLSLLQREGSTAELLTEDAFALRSPPADTLLRPGRRIGAYEVVRLLGGGGMGTVALAVRADDFEKQVALKLVRPGAFSGELVRRFHNERQILARLEHPLIARILDGGTAEDGRPYFVMEYVEGLPIDAYCERHGLDVRRRVELVLRICEALQAAHRSLVVHRDLKPSNVLVTAGGTPKLLDFGIAKVLDDGPGVTRLGQGPMTLGYASPEQVLGRPVTTASDLYSLGVVLYELLAGRSPYPDDVSGDLALARAITDAEPPPPSRHRRLDRDLDAVVAKALRKEPEERYGSAEQLAADLRGYLEGRPVTARRGTWTYRTGKLLRRHRLAFAAAALFLGVVLGFTILTTVQWRRAEVARRQAEVARQRSERTVAYLKDLFLTLDPDQAQGAGMSAREFLDRGLGKIEYLDDDPLLQTEILEPLGQVYTDLGLLDAALAVRRKELEASRRAYDGPHTLIARALNNLAAVHYRRREDATAERLYREAIDMERALGVEPETKLVNLVALLMRRGAFDEAEDVYREILESRRKRHGEESELVAKSLRDLGNLLYARGDAEAAEPLLRQAWELRRRIYGDEHTQTASALSSLARALYAQERWEEAEDAFLRVLEVRRKRLGDGHLYVALTRRDLAALYLDLGETATATVLLDQAQAVLRRTVGEDSWEVADVESLIGALLHAEGRLAAAETCLERSVESLARLRGEASVYTRNARRRLDEAVAQRTSKRSR